MDRSARPMDGRRPADCGRCIASARRAEKKYRRLARLPSFVIFTLRTQPAVGVGAGRGDASGQCGPRYYVILC